jgi:tetratricopeptide (TPR) repeat protein
MSARTRLLPVLLALLALPVSLAVPLAAWGQSADEIYCANRNGRLPANQVMAACDKLVADSRQTDLWRAKAYAWRGIAQRRAGTPTAALADFDRALELDDDNFDARQGRAQLRYEARDHAGALDDVNAALAEQPGSAPLFLLRSNIYLRLHRYGDAIADADNPRLFGGGGLILQRCRARAVAGIELDKARLACNQALWIQPEAPAILNTRGFLGLKEKRFDLAWRDFNTVLATAPRNARALYGRGLAAIALKRETEGRADLEAAIIIASNVAAGYADDGVSLKTVMAQQ